MIIAMPSDRERTGSVSFRAAKLTSHEQPLEQLAADDSLLPLAAWTILCYRLSQQAHLTIDCYPDTHQDAKQHLSISLDFTGDQQAKDCIQSIKQQLSSSLAVAANSNCAYFQAKNLELSQTADPIAETRAYELALISVSDRQHWSFAIIYNSELHEKARIDHLLSCLTRWIKDLQRNPSQAIALLPLLSSAENKSIEDLLSSQKIVYPHIPVYELILSQGQQHPQAIAVSFAGQNLSYGELHRRSSELAALLQSEGVTSGAVVAVCVRPSLDLLVALVGLWQVGAIYCPLDPTHPEAYIQQMLDLAKPSLILTHSLLPLMACCQSRPHLLLDRLPLAKANKPPYQPSSVTLESPAYLFFTSGTTGKPKGVLASHHNLAQYIHSAQQTFAFGAHDVFLSMARYTFSISLFELISPLCVGGRLQLTERHDVLNPERLLELLDAVTVVHAGPSLLSALFRHLRADPSRPQTLNHLRHVSSGGDIVSASIMEEMKRVFPRAEIFVLYGSTEIACMGTFYAVQRHHTQNRSLVGRSFPGVQLRVVNANLENQPFGVVGEICFGGPGLALGYYQRPDLEQDKFISIKGQRFYRMGDMGRLRQDGNLEMLGRADYQIQLRGIRIELIGIENTVRELKLAQQCAVVHKKDRDQEFLVFFLMGARHSDISLFRKELAAHLPEYMLPQYVVSLENMPLTVNGKLDRQALQALPWQPTDSIEPTTQAHNPLAQQLAAAFATALNRPSVGTEQNFFDLGGHSMLAILLLQDIREKLHIIIPPQVFFERATVKDIVLYLESGRLPQLQPIAINSARDKPNIFMLAGVQTYRPLAKRLEQDFAAFAVFTLEELSAQDATSEALAIQRLAEHYLQQIMRMQPKGPYHLLGYSFAGIVAYEVAQRLRSMGEPVKLLVLIDAIIPEWDNNWTFRWRQLRRVTRRPPQQVFRFVIRRIKEIFGSKLSALNQHRDDPKLGHLQEQRVIHKSIAAVKYLDERQSYPEPCLLIVSEERLQNDPLKSRNCGWAEAVPLLEVQSVPGDHFKMVEFDPDVSEIARLIAVHYRHRLETEKVR